MCVLVNVCVCVCLWDPSTPLDWRRSLSHATLASRNNLLSGHTPIHTHKALTRTWLTACVDDKDKEGQEVRDGGKEGTQFCINIFISGILKLYCVMQSYLSHSSVVSSLCPFVPVCLYVSVCGCICMWVCVDSAVMGFRNWRGFLNGVREKQGGQDRLLMSTQRDEIRSIV